MLALDKETELEQVFPEQEFGMQEIEEEYGGHQHEHNISDLMAKLSGVILRKAEFENNYSKVYAFVLERMAQLHSGEDLLWVFGEVGG